jgi:HlyD family secretion protein
LEEKRFGSIETGQDPRSEIRKLNLIGLAVALVLVGGVGGWAATSQLSGAVIAPGTVVVESNVKKAARSRWGRSCCASTIP